MQTVLVKRKTSTAIAMGSLKGSWNPVLQSRGEQVYEGVKVELPQRFAHLLVEYPHGGNNLRPATEEIGQHIGRPAD